MPFSPPTAGEASRQAGTWQYRHLAVNPAPFKNHPAWLFVLIVEGRGKGGRRKKGGGTEAQRGEREREKRERERERFVERRGCQVQRIKGGVQLCKIKEGVQKDGGGAEYRIKEGVTGGLPFCFL
jgi:hypothetical protein